MCYVCSRCLSMLGHSGINIVSGFSNIHLSTRACDFVYHICSIMSNGILSFMWKNCPTVQHLYRIIISYLHT